MDLDVRFFMVAVPAVHFAGISKGDLTRERLLPPRRFWCHGWWPAVRSPAPAARSFVYPAPAPPVPPESGSGGSHPLILSSVPVPLFLPFYDRQTRDCIWGVSIRLTCPACRVTFAGALFSLHCGANALEGFHQKMPFLRKIITRKDSAHGYPPLSLGSLHSRIERPRT